jgi:hypothetical protein
LSGAKVADAGVDGDAADRDDSDRRDQLQYRSRLS